MYSWIGLKILFASTCSIQWAAHPTDREMAKTGVKRSMGMRRTSSPTAE